MEWHQSVEPITPDDGPKRVYWTSGGPLKYRIYGRWDHKEKGYRYRAEYELETGWWLVGQTKLLRGAKALIEADAEKRLATSSPEGV